MPDLRKVRVKDVPYDEIKWHLPSRNADTRAVWQQIRGQELTLTGRTEVYTHLEFPVVGHETTRSDEGIWVCSICADIGD